jgi:BirA family transcriptional regulator, biotin operon repressor / biotin---[acetyl-CoA-carboxylase] ligase
MLYKYEELGSTQDKLKELFAEGEVDFGDGVQAESQTAGRGRFGRKFYSPPKSGIYLSVLLPFTNAELLTVGAAVAVLQSIEEVTGKRADVKWVNDVYLNGKKIAGILAEAVVDKDGKPAAVILGVGINVVSPTGDFPEDIQNKAGVLFPPEEVKTHAYKEDDLDALRESLTFVLLTRLIDLPEQTRGKAFFNEYKARLLNPQDVPEGFWESAPQ